MSDLVDAEKLAEAAAAERCAKSPGSRELHEGKHLTDAGNAERFEERHGPDVRHVRLWNKWLFWDGARFVPDETGEADRRALDTIRATYAEAAAAPTRKERAAIASHAKSSESAARLRSLLAVAASLDGIAARGEDFDRDPWLLNVANGTLDLRTGSLREHRREDLQTKVIPVPYDPASKADTFRAFLDRVLPAEDVRDFVQRAIGYSLTGCTDEQVMFMCWGTGANGKTTFTETMLSAMSDYGMKSPSEMVLAKRGDSIPNDVARLRGARFVAMAEIEDGRRLAEQRVKELTGGDTVTARFMRAEFFDFKPVAKFWVSTNHRPMVRGTDEAIWRRIRLIPFDVTIPAEERDAKLPEKIEAELPGVLAWAVEGCLEWQRSGLAPPPEVLAATENYRNEQDVLGAFLEERCHVVAGGWVSAADLYSAYRAWSEVSGERRPMAQRQFGMELAARGFVNDRKGHGGRRVWHGLGLLREGDG